VRKRKRKEKERREEKRKEKKRKAWLQLVTGLCPWQLLNIQVSLHCKKRKE